jgi:hypothetical protein
MDDSDQRVGGRYPASVARGALEPGVHHSIVSDIMTGGGLPTVVTINRPDVVTLIEEAASKLTGGNKTEAVALAMRRLLDQNARAGSLFGAHPGSVKVREDVDLTSPVLDDEPEARTGREVDR